MPDTDDGMKIVFDGKEYALDDFTLGEIEQVEDFLGSPLDEAPVSSMKFAIGFVTVLKQRENPDHSYDDTRKLKLSVFNVPDGPEENRAQRRARPTKAAQGG